MLTKISIARILAHWLLAAALLAQIFLGWWMLGLPKTPIGLRAGWFNLHKSIGISIAAAVLLWLAWRMRQPVSLMDGLAAWQRRTARSNHAALYALALLLPLTGLLGSLSTRYPVLYFGLPLPAWNHDWPAAKQWLSALHLAGAWLLMSLAGLHAAAGLWHWWNRHPVARAVGLPLGRNAK